MYIDRVEKIFGQKHRRGDLALVLQQNKSACLQCKMCSFFKKGHDFQMDEPPEST